MVEPTAKGRPRLAVINGHGRAFTPAKTRNAESMIQALIRDEVIKLGTFDSGTPLKLSAVFYRERPAHLPKRITTPVTRPDLDNYLKLLLDSLNKYVFPDDSQICSIVVDKRFGNPPRIELIIEEV